MGPRRGWPRSLVHYEDETNKVTLCSRSREDFGMHACNASNLWPDRLRGLRDEVVEDVAVDVGQATVDAVGSIR
jgi:hypothetical protein